MEIPRDSVTISKSGGWCLSLERVPGGGGEEAKLPATRNVPNGHLFCIRVLTLEPFGDLLGYLASLSRPPSEHPGKDGQRRGCQPLRPRIVFPTFTQEEAPDQVRGEKLLGSPALLHSPASTSRNCQQLEAARIAPLLARLDSDVSSRRTLMTQSSVHSLSGSRGGGWVGQRRGRRFGPSFR